MTMNQQICHVKIHFSRKLKQMIKTERDITTSLIWQAVMLVKIYAKIFKTSVIVFMVNVMVCLTSLLTDDFQSPYHYLRQELLALCGRFDWPPVFGGFRIAYRFMFVLCFMFSLSLFFILCTQLCQFLLIFHCWSPLRFSVTFLYFNWYDCWKSTIVLNYVILKLFLDW